MTRKAIKRIVHGITGRFGFELVRKESLERVDFARHLRTIFERLEVDTVIDVGANAGQYHDFLRGDVRFEGAIHSFEPIKRLSDAMGRRAAFDAKWTVHAMALGGSEGTTEFNVMRETQFSSMLSPKISKLHNFASLNRVEQRQAVRVRKLDDVVAETPTLKESRSLYLKLDTQGYDLEVLKGASRTLDSVGALQTEASILPIYEGMPDYKTSIATLDRLGFDISGMFPVVRDQFLRIVEFDCVLVNRERLGVNRL